MSKEWPLPRKGNKYVVVPRFNKKGLPLLIVLRDLLKYGKTKKEVRKIMSEGNVKINGVVRIDEKLPVFPLDKINVGGKIYSVGFKGKKLEIEEADSEEVIRKVIGKKLRKGNKIQLNLLFGDNILSDGKEKIGDSLVLDENKKVIKVLKLEKGCSVLVISGKHMGNRGKVKEINEKNVVIESKEKMIINKKDIIVIENGK